MTSRKTVAIPSIAVLAVAGGLAVAGCGSNSSADTTQQSQNGGAMKHETGGDSMKHESNGDSMQHENSMHDNGSGGDHMGG